MPAPPRPDRAPLVALRAQPAAEAAAPPPAYETGVSGAARLLARAAEDHELVVELLRMAPMERIAAASSEPRFHRPSLVRLLALAVEAALEDPARDPRPAAELGATLAAALPRDPQGKARRAAAWAWWLFGKALLGACQWSLARSAFQAMGAFFPRQPGPSEEAALAAAGLGQAWEDAGEVDAAEPQLLYAAYLYARLGADTQSASCYAQAGFVRYETGSFEDAAPALRAAVERLDAAFAPSLAARIWLALAEIETALGRRAAAGECLERARALVPLARSAAEALDGTWRLARIALAAGDDARADALFERVQLELLVRGSLDEAARCTCEQVLARIDTARFDAAGKLARALASAFPGAGQLAAEIAALPRLARKSRDAALEATLALRRRLRQQPLAVPGRLPALTPTRVLADRLLRQRGELEDPIGSAADVVGT
jgi:tetratricopeptide (TPR) repeat protein